MELYDDESILSGGGGVSWVRHGRDSDLEPGVTFHYKQKLDPERSKSSGRPIHAPVLYVKFTYGEEVKNVFDGPATPEHSHRFPRAFAQFQRAQSKPASGTVLDQWQFLTRSQAEDLKALGLLTVEELAMLSDEKISGDLELMRFRDQAEGYLKMASGKIRVEDLVIQNKEQEALIGHLQTELQELQATIKTLKGKQ